MLSLLVVEDFAKLINRLFVKQLAGGAQSWITTVMTALAEYNLVIRVARSL